VFAGRVFVHYATPSGTKTVTAAAAGGSTGSTAAAPAGPIITAPAFSTGELPADPTDNWITNGGSLLRHHGQDRLAEVLAGVVLRRRQRARRVAARRQPLSEKQIQDVAAYVVADITHGKTTR